MEIAQLITDSGVVLPRDEKQVRNKIQHLERQFREAFDFANTQTGAGLLENDRGNFDSVLLQKCSHYFDLLEVFSDRASSKPKATNMDTSLASSDTTESALSDDDKTSTTKRRASSCHTSPSKRNKKFGSILSVSEQTSAATVRLANVKSELLTFQLAKLEEDRKQEREDRALERQNKSLDCQMHLVKQCLAFVRDNPGWPKDDILRVFPAFEPIIDMVLSHRQR